MERVTRARSSRARRTRRPRVLAVVAARDEDGMVAETVRRLRDLKEVSEVIVVDDASRDQTARESSSAGARVLVAPRHLGKGGALEGALDLLPPADAYLFTDADTAETAGEAVALLVPLMAGEADVAVGALPTAPRGGFGLAKRASRFLVRRIGGADLTEPMSGQRALTGQALDACRPLAAGFGAETGMGIDAARLGLRIVEVPVAMRHRARGRTLSGFAHRAGQGIDLLAAAVPRALGIR